MVINYYKCYKSNTEQNYKILHDVPTSPTHASYLLNKFIIFLQYHYHINITVIIVIPLRQAVSLIEGQQADAMAVGLHSCQPYVAAQRFWRRKYNRRGPGFSS